MIFYLLDPTITMKLKQALTIILLFFLSFSFSFCNNKKKDTPQAEKKDSALVKIPTFNADSAYAYVQAQVDFGPRTPNSKAHKACGDYLINYMKNYGADVYVQETILTGFDGKKLNARNIIGSYNAEKTTRILLLAHWDTRPWSDHDPDPANRNKALDGANDAGSGVGVLMEIARQLNQQLPTIGVDILLTDMEDYGEPQWHPGEHKTESWCLGSQHWANNPHIPGYRAKYGILLDMVGAPNATFPKEEYSMNYAPFVVEKVWNEAKANGFGNYFINKRGGAITDDHVPINQVLGIPTIDIIYYTDNGFGSYWHTQNDTMENIDKGTLRAVGQTLLGVIYKEKE